MGVRFGDFILEGFIHVGKLREGFRPPFKKKQIRRDYVLVAKKTKKNTGGIIFTYTKMGRGVSSGSDFVLYSRKVSNTDYRRSLIISYRHSDIIFGTKNTYCCTSDGLKSIFYLG